MWKKRVLLRFVEPVNLIDEDDGALRVKCEPIARRRNDLAHLGDAAEYRAERDKVRGCGARDDACQGRLAAPGRAPKDHGANAIGGDGLGEQRLGAKKVALADELGERVRPHAIGEGCTALRTLLRRGREEGARGIRQRTARARRHRHRS